MSVKLTKFPVTAPDGTEYRVSIRTRRIDYPDEHAQVRIYTRSWYGFKRVYTVKYGPHTYGLYWGNYVQVAKQAVSDYQHDKMLNPKVKRKLTRREREDLAGKKLFEEWNGKITKEGE